jgi:hypothetical protein
MSPFTPQRSLNYLEKTTVVISYLFKDMTTERSKQLAPGVSGWSALEVMGHLVDLEAIFTARLKRMLNEENPTFEKTDPDQMAIDHAYASQDIQQQVTKFITLRQEFIALLKSLSEEQWNRTGVHPAYGPMTVLDLATNTPLHDLNHLGQISEALGI